MDASVRKYLAAIGRRGGRASRRELSPETARQMVRIREARRAYRKFHAQCFWYCPPDLEITTAEIPWVADQLMKHGDRVAWRKGASLCR